MVIEKKHIVLLGFIFIKFSAFAQSKDTENLFKGIATLGMNACQIDGDGPYGYNYIGVTGGIGVMVHLHKNLSASLEMLYSMRGSVIRRDNKINPQTTFEVVTDYIEIPLCLNITDKKLVMATVGLSPAVLARYNLKYQEFNASGAPTNAKAPPCLSDQPSRFDLSIVAGFQFYIGQRIGLGARYSYSLIGIRSPCPGETKAKSQHHNVITLKATYIF